MNKLFGLLLLALVAVAPGSADAASRFLTCSTTCTIDASNTAIWGTVSGGTGASVPTTTDDVILDASTCVGGTTCTATFGAGYNPTWISLTMSACTASTSGCILDANTNSNTITLTATGNAYVNSGSGTRTLSGGTWILSGNTAVWNIVASATVTNSPSVSFTGTGGNGVRRLIAGGKTYGTVTVASGTSPIVFAAGTITTLTIAPGNSVAISGANTLTVTTMTNITGSSSAQTLFTTDSFFNGRPTISSANNWTCTWCGMGGVIFSGGGAFSATSSFDFLGNSGITISPPSGGGGGGGRIIGG